MKPFKAIMSISMVSAALYGMAPMHGEAPVEAVHWDRSAGFDEGLTSTAAEDDARGNWYIKRKFLIEARGLYEQIKQRAPEVAATEKHFLDLRDTITHEIAQFYTVVGFEPQEIDATITATLQSLEQERLKSMQLSEKERETYADLEVLRKEITQVQQDIRDLLENERAIAQAIPVLAEQIRIAVDYEQQAWDKYERISEVLNDHLAEQLYRDIQSFLNHINAIDEYIKGPFNNYFNQTVTMLRQQIVSINGALKKLQEQGIAFESQATKELKEKQKHAHQKSQKQQQTPESWFVKILNFFKTLGAYIAFPFVFLGNKIVSLWG